MGLGDNLPQILLLVLTNAFVGGMVGIERTVLPLLAAAEFGIASKAAAFSFIATFGLTKAVTNFFAGGLSDRVGRRRLLILGWLVGLPIPLLLIYAPSWTWVLWANVLLGLNQSLTWSMTVVMKVDLATPRTYGLVIGWNEFAGYAGLAVAAAATGFIAATYSLRPEPLYLGVFLAAAGLVLSWLSRETFAGAAARDGETAPETRRTAPLPISSVLRKCTFSDRTLSAASFAGLATNLKDGALWGLLPLLLAARELPIDRVGIVVGSYPAVWAASQLYFGPLSDRLGRHGLIGGGLAVQAIGMGLFVVGGPFVTYLAAAAVTGIGTGMVYPTLLALVSDIAEPVWRASALGVYRFWRDSGYAVGAIGAGVTADLLGVPQAVAIGATIAFTAGLVFRVRARAVDGPRTTGS